MTEDDVIIGQLVDEAALTLDELARACAVEPGWVVERVQAGILGCRGEGAAEWQFSSVELVRARRLAALERDFDANEDLAALVADLIDEVQQLRAELRAARRGR